MSWVDAACCERCWLTREGVWEPSPEDPAMARLVQLRQPHRMPNPVDGVFRVEHCHFCSWPTFAGIYVRTEVIETNGINGIDGIDGNSDHTT